MSNDLDANRCSTCGTFARNEGSAFRCPRCGKFVRKLPQGHPSPPPLPKERPLDLIHDVVSAIAHTLYWIVFFYMGITGIRESGFMSLVIALVLGGIFYEPFSRLFAFIGPRR